MTTINRDQYNRDMHHMWRPVVAFRLRSPDELATLKAAAGPRQVSQFIRDAIAEKLAKEQTTK